MKVTIKVECPERGYSRETVIEVKDCYLYRDIYKTLDDALSDKVNKYEDFIYEE